MKSADLLFSAGFGDEWGGSGYRDRGGVLPGSVPAATIWRLQEAAAHGAVWHAAGLVPVFPHRLHFTPGRQHGRSKLKVIAGLLDRFEARCLNVVLCVHSVYTDHLQAVQDRPGAEVCLHTHPVTDQSHNGKYDGYTS